MSTSKRAERAIAGSRGYKGRVRDKKMGNAGRKRGRKGGRRERRNEMTEETPKSYILGEWLVNPSTGFSVIIALFIIVRRVAHCIEALEPT